MKNCNVTMFILALIAIGLILYVLGDNQEESLPVVVEETTPVINEPVVDTSAAVVVEDTIQSFSYEELVAITDFIKKNFKEVRNEVYLLEFIPEHKYGYIKGGQFTVYIPEDGEMSFFDRSSKDVNKWFNVANFGLFKPAPSACDIIYVQRKDNIQEKDNVKADAFFKECVRRTKALAKEN